MCVCVCVCICTHVDCVCTANFILLCTDIHSREQLTAFLAESLIMKDFNHPHILGLLGVCFNTPDGSPYIILPFMANGSVKTYLKEKRLHVLDVHSFPKVVMFMYINH